MRALIFDGQSVRLDDNHPAPIAQPDEAVIRLIRGAISNIDLEVTKGLCGVRGVLGHQFVGVVESVNGGPPQLVGKRVVGSMNSQCGKCDMCLAGLSRHCRKRSILGMGGWGCLAERFTLAVRNIIPVPASVDDDHAVFAVEIASAIQAASQLTIVGKPYITVLGDNSLALLTAQVMSKLNASVRVVGNNADQLAVCEKWAIKNRLASDVGRRADQDVVVECSGTDDGLELAMQLVRPRGKILLKSITAMNGHPRGGLNLATAVLNEIELIGSFVGPVDEALRLLERGDIQVLGMISRRMSLSDGPLLLKVASQPGVTKVLVDP